jgi:diacylglycerol kinase family enzyme
VRVTVVANPVAGGRRFDRAGVEALVSRVAAESGLRADLHITRGPGDGKQRAREALDSGTDLVVAWGGDGTVSEVAAVLAGTQVPLGIVPVGSGNGLARELAVPRRRTEEALRIAFARRVRAIDVPMLGDRAFVNVAGFGFDAKIAEKFNAQGCARGFTRYIGFTMAELFR